MDANNTNSTSMKLQVPTRLLEEIEPLLNAQGICVDRAIIEAFRANEIDSTGC